MGLCTANTETAFTSGYHDWKNILSRLSEHEGSAAAEHINAVLVHSTRDCWCTNRLQFCKLCSCITNTVYWRNILRRIIAMVKFPRIAFLWREQTARLTRNGHFLGCLELISEFYPLLSEHLSKHGHRGSGKLSFFYNVWWVYLCHGWHIFTHDFGWNHKRKVFLLDFRFYSRHQSHWPTCSDHSLCPIGQWWTSRAILQKTGQMSSFRP